MRVHTNVSSLRAQRALGEHTKDIESSEGKLSSGLRVRTAADDAASLAIGSNLNAKNRSLKQAERNANDAISEFQVAEGAMSEMASMLTRLRELSVNAATDTLGDPERQMLNYEYMQIRNELERVAESTRFNGRAIMQVGELTGMREFQVGVRMEESSRIGGESSKITVNEFKLNLVDSNIKTKFDAQINLKYIDKAIETLSGQRAFLGGVQQRLSIAATISNTDSQNTLAAKSRIMDADYAEETAKNMKSKQLQMGATGVLAQANNLGANALKLLKDS
jgi:flagellin